MVKNDLSVSPQCTKRSARAYKVVRTDWLDNLVDFCSVKLLNLFFESLIVHKALSSLVWLSPRLERTKVRGFVVGT